jgi:hypothetical protein
MGNIPLAGNMIFAASVNTTKRLADVSFTLTH